MGRRLGLYFGVWWYLLYLYVERYGALELVRGTFKGVSLSLES